MTPDEFRRHGREVIDWIADYMEQVEQLPVLSQVTPGEIRRRLPERAPQQGEPFAAILRDRRTRSSCRESRTGSRPISSPTSPQ